jgi:hypothetical protein
MGGELSIAMHVGKQDLLPSAEKWSHTETSGAGDQKY